MWFRALVCIAILGLGIGTGGGIVWLYRENPESANRLMNQIGDLLGRTNQGEVEKWKRLYLDDIGQCRRAVVQLVGRN